ncbi:helix-turn-helix transcriptional regulator [Novosphingobium sp. NDB2Meth1]|uniref:helix-turn-helix transcriptional regulator n=1 Tax=Novosphingobium sp. NDB2Meth1 TaxID=1892847 RepID=UPI0009FAEFB2|nr:helix-turn-helix transcriptional regulator [Novosphingobium sp. NDB2Meth1]
MTRLPPDILGIGGRLKAERDRLGLTQAGLAKLAGIVKGTVGEWEKGTSYPNAAALACFAHAGVDLLYIVTGLRQETPGAPPESPELTAAKAALAALEPADRRQLVFELLFGGTRS